MLAFYDSRVAGLVPVKVQSIHLEARQDGKPVPIIRARVTGERYGYKRGDMVESEGGRLIVPRYAVRKFRSSPFPKILAYDWRDHYAAFGVAS